ncbi:riboflavin kinase [Metabacillus litoralis]|jgi:riboflavin kinase|uniref:riboflavin kinase n=1 Tax=Metabacillus litoralis TaxID=152268 RepID=UPI00203AE5F9|nr:riboflavin kinase [Metabacillus litoralis]MCM3653411.1 riboflavin kinase [Metabacillus litoralis]
MEVCNQTLEASIKGTVVKGRQIGRTIGFPTANLAIYTANKDHLKKGVYGVKVYHDEKAYYGVMNIGVRPTFKDGDPSVSYEVHILDFHKDIYHEQLEVEVLFFVREEKAFQSKDQLIQQLNLDVERFNEQLLQVSY